MVRNFSSIGGFALGIFITHPCFGQAPEEGPLEPAPAGETATEPVLQDATAGEEPSPPIEKEPAIPPTPLAVPEKTQGNKKAQAPKRARAEDDPPTLLGSKVAIGGYGSVDGAYTRMFGTDGALVGLQAALLLDHRLSVGVAGYAWTNPRPGPDDELGGSRSYESGYLGAVFRYSLLGKSPIYPSVGALFGGGAVVLAPDDGERRRDRDREVEREDVDLFAVFQPDVSLHANLTRWLRLGVTVGYRFSAGVGRFGYDESDVNGLVAGGQVQFGRF